MNRIIEILQHKIDYWYEEDQEMPDHEEDHVKQMITDGFNQGELIDGLTNEDKANHGWWKIL